MAKTNICNCDTA